MEIKLQVINLENSDVIATSCQNVWGVAKINFNDPDYSVSWAYQNGTNNTNLGEDGNRDAKGKTNKNSPILDGNGYYHIDSQGNIIEKCPCETLKDIKSIHNIDVSK